MTWLLSGRLTLPDNSRIGCSSSAGNDSRRDIIAARVGTIFVGEPKLVVLTCRDHVVELNVGLLLWRRLIDTPWFSRGECE
jgi:hypothetical protein